MKLTDGFTKTTIAGTPYLLPYGQKIADHAHSLRLNDSGALLCEALAGGADEDMLLSVLAEYYGAEPDMLPQLKSDLDSYLSSLKKLGLLIDNTSINAVSDSDAKTRTKFPTPSVSCHTTEYFKIGTLCFSLTGADALFDTYFKDFSCPASPADQTITIITGRPSDLPFGIPLIHTAELTIFDVTDAYRFVFAPCWGIHEMRVKKDGSAAVLYCTDDYTKDHTEDLFHALRFAFLIAAQQRQLFVLHSVSILYQGKAWLFSGSSGTGKSTHASLWQEQFHTPVLNGDLNLLGMKDGIPLIYGLPWCGTSETYTTAAYPLGGIVFLKQAPCNIVESLSADEQALFLMQRLISPTWTEDLLLKDLRFAETLAPLIKIFRLNCTKDNEAAIVMKSAIDQSL